MSLADKEVVIAAPKDLIQRSSGLSIDVGSSCAKFVYATKEDLDESTDTHQSSVGTLHAITLARDELESGIEFVRQRAHLFADDSRKNAATVHATGIGSDNFGSIIRHGLNVRIRVLMELDCIAKAFEYTSGKLPRQDILEPYDELAVNKAFKYIEGAATLMSKAQDKKYTEVGSTGMDASTLLGAMASATGWKHAASADCSRSPGDSGDCRVPLAESEPSMYPYLLVVAGSCAFTVKVTGPGVYSPGEYNPCCGRTLLGIGNLLTGCKTFDELVSLASRGCRFNVDQTSSDLAMSTDDSDSADNWYKTLEQAPPVLTFNFGKTVGANLDDFKKEDLAAALLGHIAAEVVQTVQLASELHQIRRVFFGGSLLSHPDVRHLVATSMVTRNLTTMLTCQKEPVIFDFVKSGGHLAALGSLVYDAQSQQNEATQS